MEIKQSIYIGSFPDIGKCPPEKLPEYAFIGRSNVGKSSLINMLCRKKELAKISKTPGKTQTINYFLVNDAWHLVDLPGYGYAKISKETRAKWQKMIEVFLQKRKTLQCAFVLVDSNIPPQESDLSFMNQLGQWGVPFVIVYTKTDRITKNQLQSNLAAFRRALSEHWNELPAQFITSSEKGVGKDELLQFIADVNVKFLKAQ